jgi:hypothetical protein
VDTGRAGRGGATAAEARTGGMSLGCGVGPAHGGISPGAGGRCGP